MNRVAGIVTFRLIAALVLGITVLGIVITAASLFNLRKIESEIQAQVADTLEKAGFDLPGITVDGRNVILSGTVDANIDRQQMRKLAAAVPRVEKVIDNREVVNYAIGRRFELHSYAGITTVEGELPSEADVNLVFEAIRRHYGVDPLGANLDVRRPVRRPPWLDSLGKMLEVLAPLSPLEFEYANRILRVGGVVPDSETRTSITSDLQALMPEGVTLKTAIELEDSTLSATLRIEFKRGQVTVSGSVPDQRFADDLRSSLELAFAVTPNDEGLKIDPGVRHGSWLDGALRVVFPLAVTHWVELIVDETRVEISGEVNDDTELEIVNEQLREHFGYATQIINRITRKRTKG